MNIEPKKNAEKVDLDYQSEQVTFDNFKPNPDEQNTVSVFSVTQEEAELLGAMPSSDEDLKEILGGNNV